MYKTGVFTGTTKLSDIEVKGDFGSAYTKSVNYQATSKASEDTIDALLAEIEG